MYSNFLAPPEITCGSCSPNSSREEGASNAVKKMRNGNLGAASVIPSGEQCCGRRRRRRAGPGFCIRLGVFGLPHWFGHREGLRKNHLVPSSLLASCCFFSGVGRSGERPRQDHQPKARQTPAPCGHVQSEICIVALDFGEVVP